MGEKKHSIFACDHVNVCQKGAPVPSFQIYSVQLFLLGFQTVIKFLPPTPRAERKTGLLSENNQALTRCNLKSSTRTFITKGAASRKCVTRQWVARFWRLAGLNRHDLNCWEDPVREEKGFSTDTRWPLHNPSRCHLQMPPYDWHLGYRARSPFGERGRFANYWVVRKMTFFHIGLIQKN